MTDRYGFSGPCYLGVDPGATGALAWYWPNAGRIVTADMPHRYKRINGKRCAVLKDADLIDILRNAPAPKAMLLEKVGAMPRQQGGGRFAEAFGFTRAALMATYRCPLILLTPQDWRKMAGLPKLKDGKKDKKPSRERATELFPEDASDWKLVKHTDRAEAALTAYCAYLIDNQLGG